MVEQENIIDAPIEQGYSLYDLVLLHESNELDKLETKKLIDTTPHTLSTFLERLDVDTQRNVLRKLEPDVVSEIVAEMDSEISSDLVSEMREHRAVSVLNEMEPDDAAYIVRELEDEDRDRLLKGMQLSQPESAESVRELLEYQEDTAGAIMNPHVATLNCDITIDKAISAIRLMKDEYENIYYLYIVDNDEILHGVVSIRQLLFSPKGSLIKDIMTTELDGVITTDMDKEIVARTMSDKDFHTLPVVGDNNKLLGMITHDDVIDIIREENTEDFQKLAGAGADEGLFDPIFMSIKQRSPWLLVNLCTAFIASGVVGAFDGNIAALPILAVFMPIIAGIGGNTGAQTLAVTVRSLALGEAGIFDMRNVCTRELIKGFCIGIVIGFLGAILALLTTQRWDLALIVWVAILTNMSLGGLMGSFIPFALKRFGFDPASGSSVFTTCFTDSGGFFIFLGLAALFVEKF